MSRWVSRVVVILGIGFHCLVCSAQAPTELRPRALGPIVASSPADFIFVAEIRPLSDGRVLVNDGPRRLVTILDSTLKQSRVVLDSTHGSVNGYGGMNSPGLLLRGRADTSLFLDVTAVSMVVIDPSGREVGVKALPPGRRIIMAGPAPALTAAAVVASQFSSAAGVPALSSSLGLVYGPPTPKPPALAAPNPGATGFLTIEDTAMVLAMNESNRFVDTLARFATGKTSRYAIASGRVSGRGAAVPQIAATGDAWAVMADGSVAILRGREYRLSWINPDRTASESRPLPVSWKRLSDDDKQRMVDSANDDERRKYDRELAKGKADSAAGRPYSFAGGLLGLAAGAVIAPPPISYSLEAVPDYVSPFVPGRRRFLADADNNVWIRVARGDVDEVTETYDVVNRKGELIDRVRLPEGRQLIGFGPGGIAYLIGHEAGRQLIERAAVK